METDTKVINPDNGENKKPNFNKKSIVWTDTSGASLGYKLKMLRLDIKHFFQRGCYGYSRPDVWDIDSWFLSIMPKMLGDLIEGHVGYPGTKDVPTDEKWVEILTEMKHYFEEASEATCSEKNEFEDAFTIESTFTEEENGRHVELKVDNESAWENYKNRELEICNYRDEMLKKGLKLFTKYFHNLWD